MELKKKKIKKRIQYRIQVSKQLDERCSNSPFIYSCRLIIYLSVHI